MARGVRLAAMLAMLAAMLAMLAAVGAGVDHSPPERRDFWPVKELRRSRGAACLDDAVPEVRALRYGGANHSVSIAYPRWASAR